ncbi:MAG: helix-hairpin-helix domain-containing protein [Candidatus Margulisiibacteriota bacterium]
MPTLSQPQKIILTIVAVVALAIGGWVLIKTMPEEGIAIDAGLAVGADAGEISVSAHSPAGAAVSVVGQVILYVSGAVKNEGMVKLPAGSRLVDVLTAAGGLRGNADISQLNPAEKVSDGQKIVIPYCQDYQGNAAEEVAGVALGKSGTVSVNQKQPGKAALININTAKATELEKIKGIGPKLAQTIIDYRTKEGKFSQLSDLLKVKGIGQAKLKALQDYVCL